MIPPRRRVTRSPPPRARVPPPRHPPRDGAGGVQAQPSRSRARVWSPVIAHDRDAAFTAAAAPVPPKCPSRGPPAASPTRRRACSGPGTGRRGAPPPWCPPPGALRSERADNRSTSSVARNMYDNQRPSFAGHIVALANNIPRPDAAIAPPRPRTRTPGRAATSPPSRSPHSREPSGERASRSAIRNSRSARAHVVHPSTLPSWVRYALPTTRPGPGARPRPRTRRRSERHRRQRQGADVRGARAPPRLSRVSARVNATLVLPSSRPSRRLDPSPRPPGGIAPHRRGGHPSRPEGGRDSRRRRDATTRPARAR